LIRLIEKHPEAVLGVKTASKFNHRLPFLFKVLAADKPLSIQAHPNSDQARDGFERENQLGIPIDAPHRNYRDASHKPEIICALTPFWGLNGFQPIVTMARNLLEYGPHTLAALARQLHPHATAHSLERFFETLLQMHAEQRNAVIDEVTELARQKRDSDPAADWILRLNSDYPGDIGVLAPIFLNLVCLDPGQAMYLEAGQLHAYLDGLGIELMANSDNVLRGGLTPKHIDVPELLRVLKFTAGEPTILIPRRVAAGENIYDTPVDEFGLARLDISGDGDYLSASQRSVEILLVVDGRVTITTNEGAEAYALRQGESVMVPACLAGYRIQGAGQLYRASVPLPVS
jgi:mannose-6-phosphate isomerase